MSEIKGGRLIEFGWNAASFREQLPMLPAEIADHFDRDNKAIIRLHLRGVISEAERNRAIKRATKSIERALLRSRQGGGNV